MGSSQKLAACRGGPVKFSYDDPDFFGLHGKKVQAKNLKEEPLEIFCKNFYQKENYEFCEQKPEPKTSAAFSKLKMLGKRPD